MVLEGTIELIISMIISGLIVFKFGESLRSNSKRWYLGGSLISLVSIVISVIVFLQIIEVDFTSWWVRTIRGVVSGYLPATMFMYVMYAGVLSKDHNWKKKMMSIRTELSILGVILYLPHTLLYTIFSAPYGIGQLMSGEITLFTQLMTWTGLMNSLLLVVLGITSINVVKVKMTLPKWRKLHKWSYLFYFNCFVHYMTLSIRHESYERAFMYTLIYGLYALLRLKKETMSEKSELARAS
ncbi:hypothetical protein EZV73_15885 [Acidaminobacter sp. JC074]|uniref:ferric reductase-like transmembrane domain-containing protein n=1 Tax=Acidaminobacter sp. JC074 TaxID=2530199 RepID=UPI001F0F7863|nr:ferric reductase-like transmembrane domain-containing protein [Acidaminobacter sp. JC074]MCH4889076.1 hypothetical protein [Acidaminobacter sp. JC074]